MSVLLPFSILGAPGDDALDVADVFSTDPYTGNGSTQSITNGIDLSGEGGLVWVKDRDNPNNHRLHDTARGAGFVLSTNLTSSSQSLANGVTSFNSDGFDLGSNATYNGSAQDFVGWSFRKAPKFFDVVTYTGDGTSGRNIAHSLGAVPGLILIKKTSGSADWYVYHRSNGNTSHLILNTTAAVVTNATNPWSSTTPTDAVFTVNGSSGDVNVNSATYVAYLFAHDTSTTGIIQCGSYTGNGSSTGPTVTLGWEPQWLLRKRIDSTGSWPIADSARDATNPNTAALNANSSDAEFSAYDVDFISTGFQLKTSNTTVNASGGTYIYMAIRAEGA